MRVAVSNGSSTGRHSFAELHHPLSEKHPIPGVERTPSSTNLLSGLHSSVGTDIYRSCYDAVPHNSPINRDELVLHGNILDVEEPTVTTVENERQNVHNLPSFTLERNASHTDRSDGADITSTDEVSQYCCSHFCRRLCKSSKARRALCDRSNLSSCPSLRAMFSSHNCFLCPLFDCQLSHWYRRRIPNENLLVLSIIQVLCGFAAIILSSVALTKAVFLYRMATGMWAGFLMLITGTQGLITARRPITCTLVGLLVLCVITTFAACLLIGVSVAGTIEDGFMEHDRTRSKSVHQVVRLIFAYQDDEQPFKDIYSQPDHLKFTKPLNLTGIGIPRLKSMSPGIPTHFSDSHLRTCQVILHVLLLLVGILNCSVSLSTSVLCGRYVCSRSRRFQTVHNPYTSRTNIVSFDNAAASQAISLLQSGNLRNFAGSGNILLAVAPESLRRHESELFRGNDSYARLDPYIHHTVSPFLPESNRSALILTQAGTGAMAWTAARAAATLLEQQESQRPTSLPTDPPYHDSSGRISRLNLRRSRINQRPRLMFTSLGPEATQMSHSSAPPYPPSSTMLYVVPSPTSSEPPMIFPPFPPTYSSLQKRPSTSIFSRSLEPRTTRQNDRRILEPVPTDGVRHRRGIAAHMWSRILPRRLSNHRLFSRTRRRNTERRAPHPRGAPSSLVCAVDRLLQPVLIVEEPDVRMPSHTGRPPNPPPYSTLYPDCEHQSVSTS